MINQQIVSIEEIATDAQSGFASGERTNDGVVQLRMNNVTTDGSLNWSSYIRVPTTQKQIEKYQLRPGDILFNNTNSPELVGKTAVFKEFGEPVVFSNHFVRLRVDEERVDPQYLAAWFTKQWKNRVFENLCTQWVNQAAVRKEDLLELKLPLPPLTEQKRIVSLLRRADRLRQLRRTAHDLSASVLQSVFLEMFGHVRVNDKKWELARFEDVCETRLGKMLDDKKQTGKNKRPYLRNFNVRWHSLDLSDIAEMDFDEKDRKEFRLQYGDVLICEGGEVGRAAIWRNEMEECYFQKALHRARPNPELANPEYIVHLLWWMAQTGGLVDSTSQVTFAHLTGEKLKELVIPVPPLSLQEEFAGVVARVESLRGRMAEAEMQVEGLFESVLSEVFNDRILQIFPNE